MLVVKSVSLDSILRVVPTTVSKHPVLVVSRYGKIWFYQANQTKLFLTVANIVNYTVIRQ